MSACNIVRMKVKKDREGDWLAKHRDRSMSEFPGMTAFRIVRTGDREYMIVGEWESMDALAAARPAMIATLDGFRDMLEDLGGGLGVTDPRSGEVVLELA